MLQVRCPSCRRLLDVPEGSERAMAVCPECKATFVPAGGVHETTVKAATLDGNRHETGIQAAPPTTKVSTTLRRRRAKSMSIELVSRLGYADFEIGARAFFIACLLGLAIAAGLGDAKNVLVVLPFAVVASAHAILYARVARGCRNDGREPPFWFFVVGSLLYLGALAVGRLLNSTITTDDMLIGFLVTPLPGALIGLTLWMLVTVSGLILLRGRLRSHLINALMPEASEEPVTDDRRVRNRNRPPVHEPEECQETPQPIDAPESTQSRSREAAPAGFTSFIPRLGRTSVYTDPPQSSEKP